MCWEEQLCCMLLQHLVTNKNGNSELKHKSISFLKYQILIAKSSSQAVTETTVTLENSIIRVHFTSKLLPSDNCKLVLLIALDTILQSHLQSGYSSFLWGHTKSLPCQTYQQLFSVVLQKERGGGGNVHDTFIMYEFPNART